MTVLTGLAKLKADHSIFEFRNRTGTSQSIALGGNDSVQVQPGAIARISSADITQMPAFSDFEPRVPTLAQLIDAGLIGKTTEANPVPAAPDVVDPPAPPTGGQTLSGKNK